MAAVTQGDNNTG